MASGILAARSSPILVINKGVGTNRASEAIDTKIAIKDVDQLEIYIQKCIADLKNAHRRTISETTSPLSDIDTLNADIQESETVFTKIKEIHDGSASKSSKKYYLREKAHNVLHRGRKEKADRRIAGLMLELAIASTHRCSEALLQQSSTYGAQERLLAQKERMIQALKAASYSQQWNHQSPTISPAPLNNESSGLDRPESRAATVKHDILSWLKAPDGSEDRQTGYATKRQRNPDSCTWLYKTSEYKSWRESITPSCLWVHGTSGTGKSILISFPSPLSNNI